MRAPEAVAAAIRTALARSRRAPAPSPWSCPTPSVRVFVLDFDSLPASLPKPFPSCVSACAKWSLSMWSTPASATRSSRRAKTECKVLAAVLPGPILAEYEAAVRAAGYEPGAVLPSSLAALEAIDSMRPCWPPT